MATAYPSPPMLRLKRSAQSGAYAMTAAWQVIYTESSIMAYIFSGAIIDLSTMQAGDIIDIRVRKQLVSGGGWVAHDLRNYVGAMPAGHQTVHIAPIPDIWGVEISARQTAGVLRTIDCEMYDAKRLGLP
jgi:hypothetical protein